MPVPPRGTPGREGSPPRLASVCAGRQRRHAPWHAPTPARGGPKHCRRSPPLRHPPGQTRADLRAQPLPRLSPFADKLDAQFDSRPGGFDSAVPLPGRQAGAIYRRDMRPRPFFVGLAGAGRARPWHRQDAPLTCGGRKTSGCGLSTSLLRDNSTIRKLYGREPRPFAARQWPPRLLRFPVDRPPLRSYCSTCRQRANQPSSQSRNARCRTVSDPRIIQLSQSQTLEFQFSPSLTV